MERSASVSAFWLMPLMLLCSSLKRQGRSRRSLMISSFHLLPIRETVVATGHSGRISSFVLICSASITFKSNVTLK